MDRRSFIFTTIASFFAVKREDKFLRMLRAVVRTKVDPALLIQCEQSYSLHNLFYHGDTPQPQSRASHPHLKGTIISFERK